MHGLKLPSFLAAKKKIDAAWGGEWRTYIKYIKYVGDEPETVLKASTKDLNSMRAATGGQ